MVYQENPVFGQSLRNSAVAKGVETPFCPPHKQFLPGCPEGDASGGSFARAWVPVQKHAGHLQKCTVSVGTGPDFGPVPTPNPSNAPLSLAWRKDAATGIVFPKGVDRKSAFYAGLGVDRWQNRALFRLIPEGSTLGVPPEADFLSTPPERGV